MDNKYILDYSAFSTFKIEYGINIPNSKRDYFHGVLGLCPFCMKKTNEIVHKSDSFLCDFGPWREMYESVWQCECGWWQTEFYSYMQQEPNWKDWMHIVYSSQLKRYKIDDKNIPIEVLRSHLASNNCDVYNISDKKMEELVASVFREHYQCEVREVGKSHDGGVDLIMIQSDQPTMIQVKRRKSSKKTESVKEIRDLLGATLLSGGKSCIFLTTADHFSRDAVNSSNTAIEKGIVDSFELFDYKRFFEMQGFIQHTTTSKWKELLMFERNHPSYKRGK